MAWRAHQVIDTHVLLEDGGRKSRGFGFVEFEDEESIKRAIIHLNGIKLMGRNLKIKHAESRSVYMLAWPSWGLRALFFLLARLLALASLRVRGRLVAMVVASRLTVGLFWG
mgnify:CR=1 FL=1